MGPNYTDAEITVILNDLWIFVLYYDRIFRFVNIAISIFAIFENILHFSILTRKELRTTSIFILMIGIVFSDIFRLITSFLIDLKSISRYANLDYCKGYDSFNGILFDIIIKCISTCCTSLSSWFIIWMASIRVLSIAFPMSSFTMKLSEECVPVIKLMVATVISIPFLNAIFGYRKFGVIKKLEQDPCYPNPSILNITTLPPQYTVGVLKFKVELFQFIDSMEVLSIFKPVFHICITVFLLRVVREAARVRMMTRRSEVNRTESTTRLITLTTVFYFCSELPGWCAWIYKKLSQDDSRYAISIDLVEVPILFFISLNSISHFFVCFFMSSQYRDTVKSMVGCGRIRTAMLTAEVATGSIPINTLTS